MIWYKIAVLVSILVASAIDFCLSYSLTKLYSSFVKVFVVAM